MTVEVTINGVSRSLAEADARWIARAINGRKNDHVPVLVQVVVKMWGVDVVLISPSRPSGSVGRIPNSREREIFELWLHHHMDAGDLHAGNLVGFLRDLRRFL